MALRTSFAVLRLSSSNTSRIVEIDFSGWRGDDGGTKCLEEGVGLGGGFRRSSTVRIVSNLEEFTVSVRGRGTSVRRGGSSEGFFL